MLTISVKKTLKQNIDYKEILIYVEIIVFLSEGKMSFRVPFFQIIAVYSEEPYISEKYSSIHKINK